MYLKNQFRSADVNSSGYLDYDEVRELCKALNIKLDREELRILFNEANTEKTDPASKEKGEVKVLRGEKKYKNPNIKLEGSQ